MRQMMSLLVTGLLVCSLSGCVVHDHNTEQAPMWWPAFMVRQGATEDQWGGQSIYGGDRWKVDKQGVGITHAAPVPWMQSLPFQPAQPEM